MKTQRLFRSSVCLDSCVSAEHGRCHCVYLFQVSIAVSDINAFFSHDKSVLLLWKVTGNEWILLVFQMCLCLSLMSCWTCSFWHCHCRPSSSAPPAQDGPYVCMFWFPVKIGGGRGLGCARPLWCLDSFSMSVIPIFKWNLIFKTSVSSWRVINEPVA